MMTNKKASAKSDAFLAIHSAARGLFGAGAIDKATMRDYDKLCLREMNDQGAKGMKRFRKIRD